MISYAQNFEDFMPVRLFRRLTTASVSRLALPILFIFLSRSIFTTKTGAA